MSPKENPAAPWNCPSIWTLLCQKLCSDSERGKSSRVSRIGWWDNSSLSRISPFDLIRTGNITSPFLSICRLKLRRSLSCAIVRLPRLSQAVVEATLILKICRDQGIWDEREAGVTEIKTRKWIANNDHGCPSDMSLKYLTENSIQTDYH